MNEFSLIFSDHNCRDLIAFYNQSVESGVFENEVSLIIIFKKVENLSFRFLIPLIFGLFITHVKL